MTDKMLDVIWYLRINNMNSWFTLPQLHAVQGQYKTVKATINALIKSKNLLTKVENSTTYYAINFDDMEEE